MKTEAELEKDLGSRNQSVGVYERGSGRESRT